MMSSSNATNALASGRGVLAWAGWLGGLAVFAGLLGVCVWLFVRSSGQSARIDALMSALAEAQAEPAGGNHDAAMATSVKVAQVSEQVMQERVVVVVGCTR